MLIFFLTNLQGFELSVCGGGGGGGVSGGRGKVVFVYLYCCWCFVMWRLYNDSPYIITVQIIFSGPLGQSNSFIRLSRS